MAKDEFIEMNGLIKDVLPGGKFVVELEANNVDIQGHLSGKMRQHHIRVLPGDKVKLEISPYDLTKGRIVYRFK